MNKIFTYSVAALVVAGFTIAVLFFTGLIPGSRGTSQGSGIIAGAPQIGGAFELVDNKGNTVTDKTFHGKMSLIFFGYTFCPDVCPTEMQTFAQVMEALGDDAEQVTPIFITVDPSRDTVEVVDEFVQSFHPAIVGLTGSEAQVETVKKMYRAYSQKQEDGDPEYYLVDHTSFTYLMGPDGQLSTVFRYGTTPEEITTHIKEQL
ncbi:SCO family protein [Sneathiella aquimaris]|uniref:SCO family protein n=1 Tax=Sneathiella aquimaris TaxID=2599305 RepID=UPI00146F8D56|nr:SCO family protein [Sneathiella aquimaris]